MTVDHINKTFVTLILNGLHPYPSLRRYWKLDTFAFKDSTIKDLWGGKNTGYRQLEILKKFLRFAPAGTETHDDNDLFAKTRPLTDMLHDACCNTFDVGKELSCDEIDINTQASFEGSEKIKYKKEGDGILNDALCSSVEGALLAFCFRKDSVEMLRSRFPEIYSAAPELSPLHLRCLGLLSLSHIKDKWRTCWMDNLFPSLRFFYYAHTLNKTHMCGLFRGKRGFPVCAWQKTLTGNAAVEAKGTLKKASLMNDTFGALAIS